METSIVTATDFKTRVGQYIDASGKAPVYITKHNRPVRVLLDIDEYERLISMKDNKPELSFAWQQAIASLRLEGMDVTEEEILFLQKLDRMELSDENRIAAIHQFVMSSDDE